MPYPAIHRLNNDILLSVFNCYRFDDEYDWNYRLLWCKLSHVCQRWRHLIYECPSHLGMHIKCTNRSPLVNKLDHLPLLPLFVYYSSHYFAPLISTRKRDELGMYHTLRLHGRIRYIELALSPSILHKVLALMDGNFPILEHLSVSCSFSLDSGHRLPLTLPKAFLAPNLHQLTLFSIGLPKGLRVLTSTVFLITLTLSDIQTSNYFRPRLLVARLRSLPLLEALTIEFSIPTPHHSTEKELLGEEGAPITLPSLKTIRFDGVGAYLESLVAQIRVPLLEQLTIRLFNQIAFVLPHLFDLIDSTKAFKLSSAKVGFHHDEVYVSTVHDHIDHGLGQIPFTFCVKCKPLDWQIDFAAQICHALIPTLSGVEELSLYYEGIPTELRNDAIDRTTCHDLLRSFIGVKKLYIFNVFLEELSRALQVDEVGSDPGFLPHLRSIHARRNLFTSFIDTRQVVGRPVQFEWYQW